MTIDSDYTKSLLSKVSESYKANFEPRDPDFYPFHKNHFRFLDKSSGKFSEPFVSTGLKNELPKLNIETGQSVNVSLTDVNRLRKLNSTDFDLRVISYTTAKRLGLELIDDAAMQEKFLKAFSFPDISDIDLRYKPLDGTQSGYFKATLNHGFLISLDEIKDRDFVNALDNAAKACAPKISFDDAKYEPIFNKLEQYFNQLNVKIVHDYIYDYDVKADDALISNENKILVNYDSCWDLSPFDNLLPAPVSFKSENDYLRTASQFVVNELIYKDTSGSLFEYKDLVINLSASMFAEHIGVPIDQAEINRLSANHDAIKMFSNGDEVKVFELAAKYANQAINLELNKSSDQYTLWSNFKNNIETITTQMATPSLDELCKQNNIALNKDNVIKALNDMTSQKVNEVAQSKEPIKAALSQDKPISNSLVEKLRFALSANKPKESQTKGVER